MAVKSSLKISDSSMDELRRAAEANSRSLASQAEHWMNIGRRVDEGRAPHPDVRFEVIAGAGHVCNVEAPEAYNGPLLDLLGRLP